MYQISSKFQRKNGKSLRTANIANGNLWLGMHKKCPLFAVASNLDSKELKKVLANILCTLLGTVFTRMLLSNFYVCHIFLVRTPI